MDDDQSVVVDDVVVAVGSYVPAARLGTIITNPPPELLEIGITTIPDGLVGAEIKFGTANSTPTRTVVIVGDTLPIGSDVPDALEDPLPLPAPAKTPCAPSSGTAIAFEDADALLFIVTVPTRSVDAAPLRVPRKIAHP